MTVKTSYAPGEPIWVDLGSPDLAAKPGVLRRAVRLDGPSRQ